MSITKFQLRNSFLFFIGLTLLFAPKKVILSPILAYTSIGFFAEFPDHRCMLIIPRPENSLAFSCHFRFGIIFSENTLIFLILFCYFDLGILFSLSAVITYCRDFTKILKISFCVLGSTSNTSLTLNLLKVFAEESTTTLSLENRLRC